MRLPKQSVFVATALACATSQAQPTDPQAVPAPTRIEPPVQARDASNLPSATFDPIDDIDEALSRARSFYRVAPVAERVEMKLFLPDGSERQSTITVRIDAGPTVLDGQRQRRLFLDLGRLLIAANDEGVLALSPQEPSLYFQAPVSEPLTLVQLWNSIPPVQLPQLEWAFAEDTKYLSRIQAAILQVSWDRVQTTDSLGAFLAGASPEGEAMAEFTQEGRLVMLNVQLGKDGPRVELNVTALEPASGPWTIGTDGRKQVPSLADLRPRPTEVVAGSRLPALSLMTKDLEAWSLHNELNQAAPHALRNVPIYGLLLVYRPTSTTGQQDAQIGARAITLLSTNLSNSQPDPARRPRLTSVAIALMDLADVNRTKLAAINDQWLKTPSPPARAFSPAGSAEMERISKGSSAALVVVDNEQKVLATIPLDGRADPLPIAHEIEAAIAAASPVP